MRPLSHLMSPAVLLFAVMALAGCGSAYVSPYVSCSTPQRHYLLRGAEHGSPRLLGIAGARSGSVLYAEGRSGLVYVSRSRGATWRRFGRGVQGVPCSLVGLDVRRPKIMFAANTDQLARTVDGGSHWTTVELPGSARATHVAIDPSDDRVVYAWGFYGGNGGLTAGPPPGGLFRSGDFGVTWKRISDLEPNAVAVSASSPGTLLVTTESGLYQTTDGGVHWRAPHEGLPYTYHQPDYYDLVAISPTTVADAFVEGQSDRQMAAGAYDGQFTTIIFRTTDDGVRWAPSLRLIDANDVVFAPGSASVAYVVGDQSNAAHTGATRFHVFRTDDGRQHWFAYTGRVLGSGGLESRVVSGLFVDPAVPGALYGGTSNAGIARSVDRGQTWSMLPRLPDAARPPR